MIRNWKIALVSWQPICFGFFLDIYLDIDIEYIVKLIYLSKYLIIQNGACDWARGLPRCHPELRAGHHHAELRASRPCAPLLATGEKRELARTKVIHLHVVLHARKLKGMRFFSHLIKQHFLKIRILMFSISKNNFLTKLLPLAISSWSACQ
jgi:hypothetical protein